jgi:hypothetical protein
MRPGRRARSLCRNIIREREPTKPKAPAAQAVWSLVGYTDYEWNDRLCACVMRRTEKCKAKEES